MVSVFWKSNLLKNNIIFQAHVNKWSVCSVEKMNEYDFSCVEESGGGLDGGAMSGCKDMDWAKTYCDLAKSNNDCKGEQKAFFEEYCPKTCNKCWLIRKICVPKFDRW